MFVPDMIEREIIINMHKFVFLCPKSFKTKVGASVFRVACLRYLELLIRAQ